MCCIAVIGSRNFRDYKLMKYILDKIDICCIVSGGAIGADYFAEKYAKENGITSIIYKPNWKKYGKFAGYIRNKDIIDNCDEVIAFWDGKSRGTLHSIKLARKQDKKIRIIDYINYNKEVFI